MDKFKKIFSKKMVSDILKDKEGWKKIALSALMLCGVYTLLFILNYFNPGFNDGYKLFIWVLPFISSVFAIMVPILMVLRQLQREELMKMVRQCYVCESKTLAYKDFNIRGEIKQVCLWCNNSVNKVITLEDSVRDLENTLKERLPSYRE